MNQDGLGLVHFADAGPALERTAPRCSDRDQESYVTVRSRSINPVLLVVFGGAVIVVLMVAALHPPGPRSEPAPSAGGRSTGPTCPDRTPDENTGRDPADDPTTCWLMPIDPGPAAATSRPDRPTKDAAVQPVRPAASTSARTRGPSADPSDADPTGNDPDDPADPETATVSCPDVEHHLPAVPAAARSEVTANLAELRQQIDDADDRLADLDANPVDDPNFVQNTILGPLKDRRVATLDRITIAIGRSGTAPSNLAARAPCTLNG